MARYLVSFPDGAMSDIPDDEFAAVGEATHEVVRAAKDAGVWVHGGGMFTNTEVTTVRPDGTVSEGPHMPPPVGGFSILDVPSRDDALAWAGKFAASCRCAQEVRELIPDPDA